MGAVGSTAGGTTDSTRGWRTDLSIGLIGCVSGLGTRYQRAIRLRGSNPDKPRPRTLAPPAWPRHRCPTLVQTPHRNPGSIHRHCYDTETRCSSRPYSCLPYPPARSRAFPAPHPHRPAMSDSRFATSMPQLHSIASQALEIAARSGASACDLHVSEGFGQTVTVRKGEVETIEHNRDKELGVTVYLGKQSGFASTSDLGAKAVADTVAAALAIARHTASDEANGLAEPELLVREVRDLDLYHPWDLPADEAIEMARACEAAAFRLDPRIDNSDGASVSTQQYQFVAANSNGFLQGYQTSRHSIACAVIASERGQMQRDDWYGSARAAADLPDPAAIGEYAGRRTLARLRSRSLSTRRVPILFEAPVAAGLIGHFIGAVSGGSLYRKSSFLLDSLDTQVFSPIVNLREDPHIPRGLASGCFDDDGVTTRARDVVQAGVVRGYFLGTYSARKLGMQTTGNAGGSHNLILAPGEHDLEGLLREMGTGLLVTDLMGQGVNSVTGDYSRGAAGFWVQGGRIRHAVEEVTIAGNLRDMFRGIAAIGRDTLVRGSRSNGSILVEGMTIAGR